MKLVTTASIILLVALLAGESSGSWSETHHAAKKRQASDELKICHEYFPQAKPLGIMVGIGWDNLRNLPKSEASEVTFRKCKTTPDRKYLIPDNVMASDLKESYMDHMANLYTDYRNYLDSKNQVANAGFSLPIPGIDISIGASFSLDHQTIKRQSVEKKSSILYTTVRYHAYLFILDPSYSAVSDGLKKQIMNIVQAIKTGHHDWAKYWAQVLVGAYGTHVITTATVGAERSNEMYVGTSEVTDESTSLTEIKWAASVSFFNVLKTSFSGGHKVSNTTKSTLKNMTRHSKLISKGSRNVIAFLRKAQRTKREAVDGREEYGEEQMQGELNDAAKTNDNQEHENGPEFDKLQGGAKTESYGKRNGSQQSDHIGYFYEDGRDRNRRSNVDALYDLVSLGQSGDPLYYLINQFMLPDVPLAILAEAAALVRNATAEYYQRNTYHGCMDPSADNFNYTANVHRQETCIFATKHNYKLGGVFQERDGDYSDTYRWNDYAPPENQGQGYIVNGITSKFGCPDEYKAHLVANKIMVEKNDSNKHSKISLHYCMASDKIRNESRTGYMFGGLYSERQLNRVTGARSCPGRYMELRVLDDLTLCLSRNYDMDHKFAVDFGGFIGCDTVNKSCASGYISYSAMRYRNTHKTDFDDCALYYCVREGQMNRYYGGVDPIVPPYMDPPTSSCCEDNKTETSGGGSGRK